MAGAGPGHHRAEIKSLIRWESSKTFGSGFATGLGGIATLPLSIPASMTSAWMVQARLAAAVAHMRGYDVNDERVRTIALACLLGDAFVTELMKEFGSVLATKFAGQAVNKVSGKALIEINKRVGFRLITKAGSTGAINLTKIIPVAGGVVCGTVDGAATRAVGTVAKQTFPYRPAEESSGTVASLPLAA